MDDQQLVIAAAVCLVIRREKKPKRTWTKKWLLNRAKHSHINLLKDLRLEPTDWRNYLRMDESSYFHLLELVTPFIIKQDTNMRQAITPHERLTATLRYLATGMKYEQLKFPTVISAQSLGNIIPETCRALLWCLQSYLKKPQTEQEWRSIANLFERRWNFPHCLGAIDGKHVAIVPPPGSGSFFYNYKKFHSIVLMACANANYEFIWCESGINGRISDGGAIKETKFYKELVNERLKLPTPEPIDGSITDFPYVFVGDEAFALRHDFMKPFSQSTLDSDRRIYNYRLSRARRVVENAFGILANRFAIFQTEINLSLKNIDLVVLTCCVLHNYLRKKSTSYVREEELSDLEHRLTPLEVTQTRNAPNEAKFVRNQFCEYFNGEGLVGWQENM